MAILKEFLLTLFWLTSFTFLNDARRVACFKKGLSTLLLLLAVPIGLSLNPVDAWPQSNPEVTYNEYQVKAVFLFKVILYVEWPESVRGKKEDPFVITIIGQDPFREDLDRISRSNTVLERKIVIQRINRIEELKFCHILFISDSEKSKQAQIFNAIQGKHILTVADYDGFAETGGMINLVLYQNKVNFVINQKAAEKENLILSSKILNLAFKIIRIDDDEEARR